MTQMTEQLLQHPLSAAFPSMPESDFGLLADDIAAHGQREPGVLFEGQVLDGWHRYRACEKTGRKFWSVELPNDVDPVAFAKSKNLHRRHMTDSQRANSVVACAKWAPRGKPAPGADLQTVAEMAKEADVSPRTIAQAKVAFSAGLGDAVKEGKVSVKRAAKIAKADPKIAKKIASGKVSETKAFTEPLPKIVPRAASRSEAKPEVDPLEKAREHAKKQNAVIKELRKTLAERDATIESLTGQLAETRDNARDLAESLEALQKSGEGDAAVAKEIKRLNGKLTVLEGTRDQYMNQCNEMKSTITSLKRQVAKLEKSA